MLLCVVRIFVKQTLPNGLRRGLDYIALHFCKKIQYGSKEGSQGKCLNVHIWKYFLIYYFCSLHIEHIKQTQISYLYYRKLFNLQFMKCRVYDEISQYQLIYSSLELLFQKKQIPQLYIVLPTVYPCNKKQLLPLAVPSHPL